MRVMVVLVACVGCADSEAPHLEGRVCAQALSTTGTGIRTGAVGDFDGDGHVDLVGAGGQGGLTLLRGHGDGTFDKSPILPGWHKSLAAADFDGDGKLDLIVTRPDPTETYRMLAELLPGMGDGTFGPGRSIVTFDDQTGDAGGTDRVVIGNFDGNTLPDLAFAGRDGVYPFLGRGDGTFAAMSVYALGDYTGELAVGDFDRDTIDDIAVADTGFSSHDCSSCDQPSSVPGRLSLLRGRADGSFSPVVVTSEILGRNEARSGANSLSVADLDDDGALDLVESDFLAPTKSRLGIGDATFSLPISLEGRGDVYEETAVADVDGDGVPDLIEAGRSVGLRVSRGRGDGRFGTSTRYAVHAGNQASFIVGFAPKVLVADVDEDQAPDIIMTAALNDIDGFEILPGTCFRD